MSREMATRTIGEDTYEFSQMGAKQSLRTLIQISKIVGKPIGMLVASGEAKKTITEKEVSPDLFGAAIGAMMERVDEDQVIDLCILLTATTVMCSGRKIDFGVHYDGKLDLMFQVLAAALEVQYGNFLQGLLGAAGFRKS